MDRKIESVKRKILPVLKKSGVVKAGLFGSIVHGKMGKNSDIDVLVEIKKRNFSLLDFVGLERKLEDALKRKVDLLEYNSINHRLKDRILGEEVRIL